MIGCCLCGKVSFEVNLDHLKIYQCHCSLCRKQTGTASSAGAIVREEKFKWLSGEENISKWVKNSGFTSHFCRICGASVPNKFRENPYYWVPAGLMESQNLEVIVNIFVSEKTKWSQVSTEINSYQIKPEINELIERLCGHA